jgi:hypothetical protein
MRLTAFLLLAGLCLACVAAGAWQSGGSAGRHRVLAVLQHTLSHGPSAYRCNYIVWLVVYLYAQLNRPITISSCTALLLLLCQVGWRLQQAPLTSIRASIALTFALIRLLCVLQVLLLLTRLQLT